MIFCQDCKFWDERKECREEPGSGMCRVNGPRVEYIESAGRFKTFWPITGSLDWCGQFKAK